VIAPLALRCLAGFGRRGHSIELYGSQLPPLQVLERHRSALRDRMDALQSEARAMLHLPEFNIGSPQQVRGGLHSFTHTRIRITHHTRVDHSRAVTAGVGRGVRHAQAAQAVQVPPGKC
jgi:hypothetical protein